MLKRWSTAEGASSDAHDPNGGREASNQPIGIAGKAPDFGPELRRPSELSTRPTHLLASDRPSIGRRIFRTLSRYCIAILIGVGATFAWQSHHDEAMGMVTTWVPPLGWLLSASTTKSFSDADEARQTGSGPYGRISVQDGAHSPATHSSQSLAATAPATAQQLGPVMLELADMRRSVDVLAAKQEQLAQNIVALQAAEQDTKRKASSASASPGAVPIPPRKPPQAAAQPSPDQSSPLRSSSVFPPPPAAPRAPLPLR